MPPKRTFAGDDTQRLTKRRCSSRLNNSSLIVNDDTTNALVQPEQARQLKKKLTDKSLNSPNVNNLDSMINRNQEKPTESSTSNFLDSADVSIDDPLSSSGPLTNALPGKRLRSTVPTTFDDDHDDDDHDDDDHDAEFRKTFMSIVPSFKPSVDRISTPFSRRNNRSLGSNLNDNGVRGISSQMPHGSVNWPNASRITRDSVTTSVVNRHANSSISRALGLVTPTTNSRITKTGVLPPVQTQFSSPGSVTFTSQKTNNIAVLETFVEYRNLKRELERAQKKIETWAADYQSLSRRMQKLEQNTFPRPNTDGRAFLEQLLDSLKSSERDEDGRTHDNLAGDLGLSAIALASFSHADPQRTVLHVFNATYPSNEEKESLINVGNLAAMRPKFLSDLLVFSRRCAPGSGYTMTMLKDAIGNSIRCARYKVKKAQTHLVVAATMGNGEESDGNNDMSENHFQDDETF